MTDILPLLPPETPITGFVGDRGSYLRFNTTAGTARADIVKVCEAHAANQVELHRSIPHYVKEPTHPSSYWFYNYNGPTEADLDEHGFPGVKLHITVPSGAVTDIRTDPWIIEDVTVSAPQFSTWDPNEPTAVQKAVAYFKRLTEFLEQIGGVTP